jgi:hypothetical protein
MEADTGLGYVADGPYTPVSPLLVRRAIDHAGVAGSGPFQAGTHRLCAPRFHTQ